MRVFLSGFAYEVGELERQALTAQALSANPALRNAVVALGIDRYRESARSPLDLALRCAARTLEQGAFRPETIDAVVYATTSFWNPSHYATNAICSFMSQLRLTNAYPFGAFLSGCGNLMSAVRLGESLLRSNTARSVLVVVSDVRDSNRSPFSFLGGAVDPARDGWSLVTDQQSAEGWSVTSDGAASFLMSGEAQQGLELLTMRQQILPELGKHYPDIDPIPLIVRLGKGFRSSTEQLLRELGMSSSDFAYFVANTMSVPSAERLGTILGDLLD